MDIDHDVFIRLFRGAYPKAVDIPWTDYEGREEAVDRMAASLGYRLAGKRLGRAVFTSKGGSLDRRSTTGEQ